MDVRGPSGDGPDPFKKYENIFNSQGAVEPTTDGKGRKIIATKVNQRTKGLIDVRIAMGKEIDKLQKDETQKNNAGIIAKNIKPLLESHGSSSWGWMLGSGNASSEQLYCETLKFYREGYEALITDKININNLLSKQLEALDNDFADILAENFYTDEILDALQIKNIKTRAG